MTDALRKNPAALLALLKGRHQDLLLAIEEAKETGNDELAETLSASVEELESSAAKLEEKFDVGSDVSAGFVTRKPKKQAPESSKSTNPVEMSSSLRSQMGDVAADFLDDYAFTIHSKVNEFIDKLRDVALELGDEKDDGVTSLRESMKVEIGRRGVEAVEPIFAEWRAGVFAKIGTLLKKKFENEAPVRRLKDKEVGNLLGLKDLGLDDDSMAKEEEPEASEAQPEELNAEAVEETVAVIAETDAVPGDAPLAVATGPVSVSIAGKAPISASVQPSEPVTATDFRPNGAGPLNLE